MSERREPTISSMPIEGRSPDGKDDAARARQQKTAGTAARPQRAAPPPVSSRTKVVRSPVAPIALVLVLVVAGFSAYTFALLLQAQEALETSREQLKGAEARLTDLENKLMLSDDESTQSITVIQAKVKENASEIRKLWGVAYDRNRKAISGLDDAVKKLQASVSSMDGKVKTAVEEVSGELRVVSELVEAQQAAISKVDQMSSTQQASFTQLQEKLTELDDQLRKKVFANEESIKAIDAFRIQVNRELLQLKGG